MKRSSRAIAAMLLPTTHIFSFPGKYQPRLSFSTLGCPDWSLDTIVKFAVANKYHGVEIRTIQGELDLTKCPAFSTTNIAATKRLLSDNHLEVTDLGSSASLHHTDTGLRKKNLDEAKHYIDLADKLQCPYIRVFPNNLPADTNPQPTLDIIKNGLIELIEYSKGSQVKVLMETHGDVIKSNDLYYIMKDINPDRAGLVWDFFNMWIVTKQTPTEVYQQLKKYIQHVHVKDGLLENGKEKYCLIGKGEAPVKEAIQLLQQDNFKGYFSFEWEKMWHREIEEPEIAIGHYSKEIMKYFT